MDRVGYPDDLTAKYPIAQDVLFLFQMIQIRAYDPSCSCEAESFAPHDWRK